MLKKVALPVLARQVAASNGATAVLIEPDAWTVGQRADGSVITFGSGSRGDAIRVAGNCMFAIISGLAGSLVGRESARRNAAPRP